MKKKNKFKNLKKNKDTYYTIGTPWTSIISSWGEGLGANACKCGGVIILLWGNAMGKSPL